MCGVCVLLTNSFLFSLFCLNSSRIMLDCFSLNEGCHVVLLLLNQRKVERDKKLSQSSSLSTVLVTITPSCISVIDRERFSFFTFLFLFLFCSFCLLCDEVDDHHKNYFLLFLFLYWHCFLQKKPVEVELIILHFRLAEG